jgi:hypothetical protein
MKKFENDVTREIDRLREQNSSLLTALKMCLPMMEGWVEGSHLIEGFARKVNREDRILARVKGVIEQAEK